VRADLHREPPRHLAHRHQQRQRAVVELHGLEADRHDLALEDRAGERGLRRQVQEVEQRLAGPHRRDLGGRRLLDLGDDVALGDHLFGRLADRGACRLVLLVREAARVARAGLEHDLVARRRQRPGAGGQERHAQLAVLGLAQNADAHRPAPLTQRASG